jgi:hypothetical protein
MEKEGKELLKEVLALHGWGGYGYQIGLVERGVLYQKTEDGSVSRYKHSCDAKMMQDLDERIKKYLENN